MLIFFLLLVLIISAIIIVVFFPNLFKKTIPKTVNVFGVPQSQTQQEFPKDNPEFTAVIGAIKPASVHQQLIKVYQKGDANKTAVFERPFYADGFRGNELTYTFSSTSASFIQTGSLGSLGCSANTCMLSWSNFYSWDAHHHIFGLDNATHKESFQQLLATYQEIDNNGCSIVGGELLSQQAGLSLSEMYKKFPTAPYYCSKSQGILPSNLMFFLQAEKTLQGIVDGDNIGSDDIRNSSL